jgi:hypothetical protein
MSFLEDAKNEAGKTMKKRHKQLEEQEQKKFQRVSAQCLEIGKSLKADILKEASGNVGAHLGCSLGLLRYRINDKNNVPGYFFASEIKNIEATEGFKALKELCDKLEVKISIKQSDSDLLDEDDDLPVPTLYFLDIEISGWRA